jgi:hypothetical protein
LTTRMTGSSAPALTVAGSSLSSGSNKNTRSQCCERGFASSGSDSTNDEIPTRFTTSSTWVCPPAASSRKTCPWFLLWCQRRQRGSRHGHMHGPDGAWDRCVEVTGSGRSPVFRKIEDPRSHFSVSSASRMELPARQGWLLSESSWILCPSRPLGERGRVGPEHTHRCMGVRNGGGARLRCASDDEDIVGPEPERSARQRALAASSSFGRATRWEKEPMDRSGCAGLITSASHFSTIARTASVHWGTRASAPPLLRVSSA